MPQYTVEAFRWSGTGYNAQYNVSYTAILDDDDATYDGASDANETISINGGAFGATAGQPYVINVSFTDVNGDPGVEPFHFFNTGGLWYFVPEPGSAFTVGATLGSYQNHTTSWDYADVACFVSGTLIETKTGLVEVQELAPKHQVKVQDGTFRPVRLLLSRTIGAQELAACPNLRPVVISAGALGRNLPNRDLAVSRQHRMLCNSPIAKRMFGTTNALVAAARLLPIPGVYVNETCQEVAYYHIILDAHQVVFAEGAPSESFYICENSIEHMSEQSRRELFTLFPNLKRGRNSAVPAFKIPERKRQKRLVERVLKNDKPLFQHV